MSKIDLSNTKFGYGTMSLTWTEFPPAIEQAVESIDFATSHPEFGTKLINGGEFYGADDANLKVLKKFVDSIGPKKASQLIISIKGAFNTQTMSPDGSRESIERSITNIVSYFPKEKSQRPKLIFEPARVDKSVPYEKTIGYIAEFIEAGVIDGLSLSEVGIGSIQKAISVYAVSCVELEFALFTQDILENGILAELSKHDIPVIAYSPICRGLLTDRTVEHADTFLQDMSPNDMRKSFGKFLPDNYKHNLVLLRKLYDYAHDKKQTTLESLALSWILKVSNAKNYRGIEKVSQIIPIPSGSTKERIQKNLGSTVELSDAELAEIDALVKEHPIAGMRSNEMFAALEFA